MLSSPPRRVLLPFVGGLIAIILVVAWAVRSDGVRRQVSLSFTKQEPPLTELYFTRPDRIVAAAAGVFPRPVTFTVRNGADHSTSVRYSVVMSSGARTLERHDGSLLVPGHQAANGSVTLAEPRGVQDYLLSVTLTESKRTIFFRGAVR